MTELKFWYDIQNYQSHRRVDEVYRQMLCQRHTLAESIDQADVVILHIEPHEYASMKWADPDAEHLRSNMLSLYDGSLRKEATQKSRRALEDVKQFSTASVRELLLDRMEEVRSRAA